MLPDRLPQPLPVDERPELEVARILQPDLFHEEWTPEHRREV